MRATEHPGKQFVWRTLTVVAALAALTMAFADGAEAKKKRPFKTGSYIGTTSQGHPIGFMVSKKQVTGLFVDLMPPCFVSNPSIPMPPPSFAGLQSRIKVKKVGSIAFEQGRLKRVGAFEAPAPGDSGAIIGWIKGKKAEGIGYDDYPGCPYDFDWEARLSK